MKTHKHVLVVSSVVALLALCVGGIGYADSILGIASGSDQFKTLTAAIGASGLANTLSYNGLTVFAPTDAAFAKLPA